MNLLRRVFFGILFGLTLIVSSPLSAHPADEINERDNVHVSPDGATIKATISVGAVTAFTVWRDADTNHDGTVDTAEVEAYGEFLASGFHVLLDSQPIPATYERGSLRIPATWQDFERATADASGALVTAIFHLSSDLEQIPHELSLAVTHYTHTPYGRPATFSPEAAPTLGVVVQGGTDVDLRLTIGPRTSGTAVPIDRDQPPPSRLSATAQLRRILIGASDRPGALAFSLLVAVLLGAVHALTPGHGKTLVAAYLVGSEGRVRDAVVVGAIVTITHTGSVIALGCVALAFSHWIVPARVIQWVEIVSGASILGLGVVLLAARLHSAIALDALRRVRRARGASLARVGESAKSPGVPSQLHEHEDGTVHAHGWLSGRPHEHAPIARLTPRSLVLLGVSGGVVPCPDAFAILLVAVAAGHAVTGIIILLGFSFGLACTIIALGVAVTSARVIDRIARWHPLGRCDVAHWLPAVSALIVALIGLHTLFGATMRLIRA